METTPETPPLTITLPHDEYNFLLEAIRRQEEEIAALEFRIKTLIEGE